jgi:hypothetical protein
VLQIITFAILLVLPDGWKPTTPTAVGMDESSIVLSKPCSSLYSDCLHPKQPKYMVGPNKVLRPHPFRVNDTIALISNRLVLCPISIATPVTIIIK